MPASALTTQPDDCPRCRHFEDDPQQLEKALPGLTILSSAAGSTRGRAGLCACHDTWQDPVVDCPDFQPRVAAMFPGRAPDVTAR